MFLVTSDNSLFLTCISLISNEVECRSLCLFGHLDILSCAVSIYIFWSFFNWVVCLIDLLVFFMYFRYESFVGFVFFPSRLFWLFGYLTTCSFSSSLRCRVRMFIWDVSNFSIYAFIAINFPLRTACAASHRFDMMYFNFHLFQDNFLIFLLPHWLFRNMLFSLHIYVDFPAFHSCWCLV